MFYLCHLAFNDLFELDHPSMIMRFIHMTMASFGALAFYALLTYRLK